MTLRSRIPPDRANHKSFPAHKKVLTMPTISLATTDTEILRTLPVLHELRPHLTQLTFLDLIRAQQTEGYQLAFLEHGSAVATVAGFRIQLMLHSGKTLYVDDLVTSSNARSHGYGKAMLDWLIAHARAAGCASLSLDSGTQRQDAHAFYLRERLRITSFHFHLNL